MIVVDLVYPYTPIIASSMFGSKQISRSFYIQPRNVALIKYTHISSDPFIGASACPGYKSACTAIKNAGATLISIVTPYPMVSDEQYPILVAPLANQLVPSMTTCATASSWAYNANDGPGINTAVQSALQQILNGMTRPTQ